MNQQASMVESAQGDATERAAKLFGVLATPVRLMIIGELCARETNVTHLLDAIKVSQPNMSRHLNVLFKAGIVSRRRSGANIFYALANPSVVAVCKAVCTEMDAGVARSHSAIEI
jgi:ArsR family transcriptional regulator